MKLRDGALFICIASSVDRAWDAAFHPTRLPSWSLAISAFLAGVVTYVLLAFVDQFVEIKWKDKR